MSTAFKRASARKTYRTEWVDRWSPPKPLVGLQAIEKVLNRHTFLVCPESRLVVAVLARAIHDSLSLTNRRMRREARRFVLGRGLEFWCGLVGLQPDFVRAIARKAGYLADEKAHWRKVPVKAPVKAPASSTPSEPAASSQSAPVHSAACPAQNPTPQGEPIHA
jgi:hypothetical protein